jgi:hypothetical protein
VVRVYLPPLDEWENRSGSSFGFRLALLGDRGRGRLEEYWPGMFLQLRSKTDWKTENDVVLMTVRAETNGRDFRGPEITTTGWWTLGMSVSPDGQIHYYARPGVDDLTPADHFASRYCYGFRCRRFKTFFFNVVNRDDGRTWSTRWIIDDPELYFIRPGQPRTAQR